MKKLILITAAAMLVLASCQKENIVAETTEVNLFNKAAGITETFYEDPQFHCADPAGTCIPVTIRGEIDKVEGVNKSINDQNVIEFLKKNQEQLSASINSNVINLVKNGTLMTEVKGPNSKGEKFLVFKDKKGKKQLVIPFIN